MINNQIKEYIKEKAQNHTITDVRVGLSYCCIELDNQSVGVCHTIKDTSTTCCSGRSSGLLTDKPASEIISYLGDTDNLIYSSLALACVNAMVNNTACGLDTGDITTCININADDTVGMVGCFAPLIMPVKNKAQKLLIFERKESQEFLSESQIPEILPNCNIAIITATSLIDDKLDSLLEHTKNCREIIILGPSLPLIKDIFKPLNVSVLSGIQVVNNEKIKQLISHGYGMSHFKETVRKVNLKLN